MLSCGAMGLSAVCDCVFPDHTHYFCCACSMTILVLQSYRWGIERELAALLFFGHPGVL